MATSPEITITWAEYSDIQDCVNMMWDEVLKKEVPEGESPEKFAHRVFNPPSRHLLYKIKEGDQLLAFGLVLDMGKNYHLTLFQSNDRGKGHGGRLFAKIYKDAPASMTLGTRDGSDALGFYLHKKEPTKIARSTDPNITRVPTIWLFYAKNPNQDWPTDIKDVLNNSILQKLLLLPTKARTLTSRLSNYLLKYN